MNGNHGPGDIDINPRTVQTYVLTRFYERWGLWASPALGPSASSTVTEKGLICLRNSSANFGENPSRLLFIKRLLYVKSCSSPPPFFLSCPHPSRHSPHFPREDSAGALPTEGEVGAGPAADAAVTSEPATGGGQPELLLVPRVPAGRGPPSSHPLTPSRLPFPRRPSPSWPGPQDSQISQPGLALTHVQ